MLLEEAARTLTTGESGTDVDSRGLFGGLEAYSSMGLSVSPMVKQTAYLPYPYDPLYAWSDTIRRLLA